MRFRNGREIRLQELREGQRVRVLDLSLAEELDLVRLRVQHLQRLLKAIERRVDRVATRIEPKIIAGDVPNRPQFFE